MERVKGGLKQPVVFDGRNLYELESMQEKGFTYVSIGRNVVTP
jgi:UDPglucose 6-dehydrogenase